MKRTQAYYQTEFVEKERSTHDIAAEHDTYPNKIRRELKALGFQTRNKSQAQAAALRHGRHKHPTKGRPRPLETRLKISQSVLQSIQGRPTNASDKEEYFPEPNDSS